MSTHVNEAQMNDAQYAIVDLETTGLDPLNDRIIEIAIIHADHALTEEYRWSSLVNPQQEITSTQIHHISQADVATAPTFNELRNKIIELLHNRIIVCHNAAFDCAFLNAEFRRCAGSDTRGIQNRSSKDTSTSVQVAQIPATALVCTMNQSRIYSNSERHSLFHLATFHNIDTPTAHRAMPDAQTCFALFRLFVNAEACGDRLRDQATDRHGNTVLPAQWHNATAWAKSNVEIS
ncbi:PolC-type DNA polymerase III [Arcanobacterium bovis]|uniref:3'-5' exonuclease n=1 Tax=Arcanobacterium bovis TaxID=2529275 RepID=A0A4Q9V178_9ACTO|nr:3'-5' exonuclease [Arcanobacterium bovis]TBW22844.1 3'-5' exonuclease [Arcanobacterium bovis]